MNFYKIKLRPDRLNEFVNFCLLYHISVVLSFEIEEFWGTTIYCFASDVESNGITTEEKARLISESGFTIINIQKVQL